jgi:hypothetical protein
MPQDLEVEERYRGQGIAQTMYDYVKSKGYKIRRSGQQTDDGAKFWAKHRPKQNFWEQGVTESYEYKPTDGVKIEAHRQGDTLWIDYFEVPVKRKGSGTTEYIKFEKSLPKDIKKIKLIASDAGYGPTHDFWDRMGFNYAYPDEDNEMVKLLEASEDIPKIVYHVTPTKNIKSIAKEGLKPGIGDRSNKIMREKSGIYVFPSRLAAEDAVMNWLGDEFEDEPLTMLKIDTSGLEDHISKGAGYELIIDTIIEPNRIKKVNISLEEASGYIPSYAQRNDPRFKTALTVDVHPDTMRKNAKRFGNKISRAGIPPTARPDGKV